jgi:uncharacterized membrane protein YhhN
MMKNIVMIIFWLLAAAATVTTGNNPAVFMVVKPLLIPALLLMLFTGGLSSSNKIIATALLFSWAGDLLLLFENKNALFFIGGLICFLITHIFYIVYFLKIKSTGISLLKKQPWLAALVAAYGVSLVLFLFPHLGEMKIPVLVYAVVICSMMICSLHVYTKVNAPANSLFVAGAALFAVSDSLLAMNKFYQPFTGAGALIIFSYCAAQFLIVMGVIRKKI